MVPLSAGATHHDNSGDGPKTYKLQMLCFLRPLSFQQTLTHKRTHALTNDFRIGDKPKIEGFCNNVTYLHLNARTRFVSGSCQAS